MTHAYDEKYLDDAMKNLGEAIDFAVCICGTDLDEFLSMFVTSGIAGMFGKGVPKYISGLSGTELAEEIFAICGYKIELPPPREDSLSFSPEYWCGWTLALYQWYSAIPFKRIFECIDGEELLRLYPALHESPEQKSIEVLNRFVERGSKRSRLKTLRESRGLSQKALAELSGVNLRTLQQYEIKAKNINNAAASTLLSLARSLGCGIEDLLEAETVPVTDE